MIKYCGLHECRFIESVLKVIIVDAIFSLKVDNPNFKPIIIGDSCPLNGGCQGHPTHDRLTETDFDYITYSGDGTQFGYPIENIWISRDPDNMILDESKVDWWSIWQLTMRIEERRSQLPRRTGDYQPQYVIHEKICDLIKDNISRDEWLDFYAIVNQSEGDTAITFRHHEHSHKRLR